MAWWCVPTNRKNIANVVELRSNLREKEVEIDLLQRTFTEIGSELDLARVFQVVSERALALIDAETVLIPLVDKNNRSYTYHGGAGKNAHEVQGESLPIDLGICGWVWKHQKPWWQGVLDEFSSVERERWQDRAGNTIMVPLVGKKQFLGGISGINKKNGGQFNRRDLNLLQLFASIVAIAIENAMAVEQMEASKRLNEEYQNQLEILNRSLVESSKELEYLSLYDTVTGLPNRSLFHDRLSRAIDESEHANQSTSLLLVDIDRFKQINEVLGHENGDLLLKKIARRFEENTRTNETLARLGGDEFVIVLPLCNVEQVAARAQVFLYALETSFNIENTKIAVNASIGVSVYPQHGKDIGTLLSHADSAMYDAKNNNQGICVYNPSRGHTTRGHLTMVAELRKALDEKQFELYYQPKINIASEKVVSVEALARWTSETRGVVPPGIFIQVLEQNGLIDDFTYWVIESALQQVKCWNDKHHGISIAVNISPQTIMHPDFLNHLKELIGSKQEGRHLIFEITENLFLSEYDRLQEVLEYVCGLGVTFSIDDYGTGYSSLSRLRKMPVSELKIDQSFVRDVTEDKDDEAIVRSTIELAHNLGLTVVAEGVETRAAYELLGRLGCDTVQGYLISKPVSVDEFEEYLGKSRQ